MEVFNSQRPSGSLLFLLLVLTFTTFVQNQSVVEKRRPASWRMLNPKFRQTNLMDMMMGDAPASPSCDGQKCESDGDCCSGSVCVASGVCVAHHAASRFGKGIGETCDMGKSLDCGKGFCCTSQKRFRQAPRNICLPCLD